MIDAMIESAMRSAELAEETGLRHDRIILSAKVSGVRDLVDTYRRLAPRSDYPLHLGLTEAGMGMKGIVASTAGLAVLLNEGIGDTIRVSLTPEPGAGRELEVEVAQQVLQSMGLRSFLPQVSACPGCGRTTSTFFQEMARDITEHIKVRMPEWRETHPGVEELKVAVMGCVVNGPGESKHADIGISLPGHVRGARWPPCSWTGSWTGRSAATGSSPSSSSCSRTTWTGGTGARERAPPRREPRRARARYRRRAAALSPTGRPHHRHPRSPAPASCRTTTSRRGSTTGRS